MKKKRLFSIKAILFSALSIFMATCFFATPITVNASQGYNYAKNGDTSATVLSAYQILDNLLDEEISDLEKEHLSTSENLSLTYSSGIGISNIKTDFNENDKTLTVEANNYSYVGANGKTVTWTPKSIEGNILDSSQSYTCKWEKEGQDYVTVIYSTELGLSDDDANKLLNSAYNAGKLASQEYVDYQNARKEYAELTAEHERWQNEYLIEYQEQVKLYQDYLVEYNIYLDERKVYDAYLADYEKYLADQEKYQNYLVDLEKYKTDTQKYRENLDAWNRYYAELDAFNKNEDTEEYRRAQYQLSILSYMNKYMTELKRPLGGAILGTAVTQVLAERKALIEYGHVEARAIDLAGDATNALRELIKIYNELKTDQERYEFYIMNYEALSKNFSDLLCALDYLYHNYEFVRKGIAKEGKTQEFEILLAQLYYISNALADKKIPNYVMRFKGVSKEGAGYFDDSYVIGQNDKRTPIQILGEEGFLDINGNTLPLENGYPDIPELPVEPTVPLGEPPVKPADVYEPKAPKKVEEPQAPAVVKEPEYPKEPVVPEVPEYKPTELAKKLKLAYERGELKERASISNAKCVVTASVIKYFVNFPVVTVRFVLDGEQAPIYFVDSVELGSSVEYPFATPEKKDKEVGKAYTFTGWAYRKNDSQPWIMVDLNNLIVDESDIVLYPQFSEAPALYLVVWNVDGKTITNYFKYGESPVYDQTINGKLEKIDIDGVRKYRFKGWKCGDEFFPLGSALVPMTDEYERVYIAEFESSFIVTWKIGNQEIFSTAWQGEIPKYAGDTPQIPVGKHFYYLFERWEPAISEVSSDVTYTAIFNQLFLIGNDYSTGSVEFSDGYYTASNLKGKEFTVDGLFKISAKGGYGVNVNLTGAALKFSASSVRTLAEKGITKLVFENLFKGDSYTFAVLAYDGDGNAIDASAQAVITAYVSFDFKNGYLTALQDDSSGLNYTFDQTTMSFVMDVGLTYLLETRYAITVKSDNANVSASLTRAAAGERVKVNVKNLEEGICVRSIYVILEDNTEIEVVDGCFIMPNGSVTVGVIYGQSEYRIAFVADGKTISVKYYKHGETVVSPTKPHKASDGNYAYTFTGWDLPIETANGDAVYTAVFSKEYLVNNDLPTTNLTVLLTVLEIAVPILVVMGVVATVVLAVMVNRKKKIKINKD